MLRVCLASMTLSLFAAVQLHAQDRSAGEKVFSKCSICHQIGEKAQNQAGPVLNGVIGRPAATVPNYDYSSAMKNSGLTWDEPTIASYIRNPRAKVPGTKMSFPGLKTDQQVADLMAYLQRFDSEGHKQ